MGDSQYVTIVGDAGSGKSTLLKHFFLNSIKENFCIPILIELRDLNGFKGSLEDYVKERIFDNKLAPNDKIFKRLLKKGEFVFFFDGYDEIKSTSKSKITSDLNTFLTKYDSNRFLITTRPYSNIELLPQFHNYHLESMSQKEINAFIKRQQLDDKLKQKIISSVSSGNTEPIEAFLSNPLLLSLYIITFKSYSSIPDKKHLFYRRVLDTLFIEHDSHTKIGFEREYITELSQEEFEIILQTFSLLTLFDATFNFDRDYLNQILKLVKTKTDCVNFNNEDFILILKRH